MSDATAVDLDYQLLKLDRALFQLLEVRAAIVREGPRDARVSEDYILAHHAGSLSADEIRRFCATLNEVYASHDGQRG
jgi:hypothetical protein